MAVTEDNQICRPVLMLLRNPTPFLQPQHRHSLEGMHQCFRGTCSPHCHILWWLGLQYKSTEWHCFTLQQNAAIYVLHILQTLLA